MILFSSHSERKKMEKEREENTYPQGQRKEKDLAWSFDETRSENYAVLSLANAKQFCQRDDNGFFYIG